ncbi:MAG TPA: sigma-54 dependent transcriptional regulator [Terriglobia bacterium]|nr:sigma-54 dependent transcriptional regulator [Terriglobia bacterium]
MECAGLQMAMDTSMSGPRWSGTFEPDIPPDSVVFGRSAAMEVIRLKIRKVARTNVPVLIQGESGTGKEILARLLHFQAPWSDGPFVKVCCPAIPSKLLESELFGYERGAFTGAYGTKPGRIEMAHRGTLFLDEISDLDMGLQAKLLQLVQDGQFSRIGAREDKRVEVRVVCATNRHLDKEIEAGAFRLDLFYRVNVLDMQLPPLRERREDIPDLVAYFLQTHGAMFKCTPRPISSRLMQALEAYDWPGNIRQLENLVKRYVILGSEEEVARDLAECRPSSTFEPQIPAQGPISLRKITQQAVTEIERKIILKTLLAHHWNRKQTARALSISYRSLLYKIRDAGLSSPGSLSPAKMAADPVAGA